MKKSKTKIFALAMAAALVMSLTLPASAAQFPDMPTGWSKDAMQAAVDAGLFEGTEDGRINPTGELTRAELAKVIAKAFGATVEADLSAYTDVNGSWYTQPMALAVKMGVINGTGATSMSPTRKVTRQEAATILARALKLADGSAEDLAAFSDASEVGSWFVGPVAAMVKAGYLNGSDGKLNPTAIMTRESLAFMMYNIFTTYIQKSGEVTEVPEGNVMVSAPDVTLKGVNVTGDLIIGDGVGEGDVTIDNCTIGGGVIVRGGGVNSIHFISTTVTKTVIITKTTGAVRVVSDTESTVAATVAGGSDTVTLEGTFTTVEVATSEAAVEAKNVTAETVSVTAAEAQVTMTDSTVATVAVTAADTTVALANTTATTVTVAQAANLEMTGETKVTTMAVTSENVVVSTTGDVVITTVQTDTTVVVTGEGTVENVTGDGEVTDTPPEPDPEPSESTEPEPTESGDPTDVGVVETPAPHVHSLAWKYDTAGNHWQECVADGHPGDAEGYEAGNKLTSSKGTHELDENGRCVCGYTETVTETGDSATCGNKENHEAAGTGMTEATTKEATCTVSGTKTYTCDTCGCVVTVSVPALGHDFTVTKAGTAVAATCLAAGKEADMGCSREGCDAVQTGATIDKLDHDETGAWQKDSTYHWKVCTQGGTAAHQILRAAHSYTDGTCECGAVDPNHTHNYSESTDKCTICGALRPGHVHDYAEEAPYKCKCGAVDPDHANDHVHNWVNGECTNNVNKPVGGCTCDHSADTNKADETCSVCHAPLPHSWSAGSCTNPAHSGCTCNHSADTNKADETCSVCHASLPHNWSAGSCTNPAHSGCTCDHSGDADTTDTTCSVCGATVTPTGP